MAKITRALVDAALDQPNPTPELREALAKWMSYNEHRDSVRYSERWGEGGATQEARAKARRSDISPNPIAPRQAPDAAVAAAA